MSTIFWIFALLFFLFAIFLLIVNAQKMYPIWLALAILALFFPYGAIVSIVIVVFSPKKPIMPNMHTKLPSEQYGRLQQY